MSWSRAGNISLKIELLVVETVEEHIAVFDFPQQYGKGIPSYYRIQFGSVPDDKVDKILKLLSDLGFVSVKCGEEGIWDKSQEDEIDHDNGLCLFAEYFVGGDVLEYDSFWTKKELIELELDNI
jgi:hypothetical protein